ncbi:unnamed protein product [Polarella glacialis]|uniref:C3H1-type domain-containing protein n=1 Tax=Polarella glacialis TaxID=89957 RepID=A0A813GJK2_POLGL|nr:unnamed protein product [Polarella glacialis]
MASGFAFVNFIDPTFGCLCQCLFQQYNSEGTVTPFHVQGLENNIMHWNSYAGMDNTTSGPLVFPTPTPSQWAVNGVNTMLNSKFSNQVVEQLHKTKMCVFNKKNKCAMGASCPFAHTKQELQPSPDLAKTKLCYNFFRRKCQDARCKFAHGYSELRATSSFFKTELCTGWSRGSCKAGAACRYAHGLEELRSNEMLMDGGMPFALLPMFDLESMGMGYNLAGGLTDICEYEEAVMPQIEHRSLVMPQDAACEINDVSSDLALSDASTFCPGDVGMRRQQTAPPSLAFIPSLPRHQVKVDNTVMLRVKGTFMEAVIVDDDMPQVSMHRSWSDGDLPQLHQAMLGDSEDER